MDIQQQQQLHTHETEKNEHRAQKETIYTIAQAPTHRNEIV